MPLTGIYNSSVPQGNQQVNNTQAPIRTNFYDIYDLFKVNHGVLQTEGSPSANEGLHTVISYYNQSVDPSTGSTDMAIYAKNVGGDENLMELFVRYPNDGDIIQLTGTSSGTYSTTIQSEISEEDLSASSGAIVFNSESGWAGYQYLAGGIIMMFGYTQQAQIVSDTSVTLTFPTFPNFLGFKSTPFHMQISHSNDGGSAYVVAPYGEIYITPLSSTTYQLFANSPSDFGGIIYYWLAIGV